MRRFRFLHTADLHLGSPFQGLRSRLPELWSTRVRQAADEVFRRVVDIALEEQVDFVTIAGDVFDSQTVPMHAWFELRRGLERLADAGIQVFLSHGNHDPLAGPGPIAWPPNVYVFPAVPVKPSGSLQPKWLELAADTRIQICGFSYSQTAMTESYASAFVRERAADFAIGLYHGSVGPLVSTAHANYCPTSVQELTARGFDVFALGHIHQPMVLSDLRPLVFYPGIPQGRHMREAGTRGVAIVDVDERGHSSVEWRRTSALTFEPVDVSLDDEEDLGRVPRLVVAALRNGVAASAGLPGKQDWRGPNPNQSALPVIARAYLTGVTSLASTLQRTEELRAALMEELRVVGLPYFIESIDSELVPALDRDALLHSSEFIGEFLRIVDECRTDPTRARDLFGPVLEAVFHDGSDLALIDAAEERLRMALDGAERQVLTWYAAASAREEETR